MPKQAKYKVYNGTTWEELTFPPSDHTHSEYTTEEEVVEIINQTISTAITKVLNEDV